MPHRNENWRTCHFKRDQFGGKILKKKNQAIVGVLTVETVPGNERRPGCLGYIGDDTFPNQLYGDYFSLTKDPNERTRIQRKVRGFVRVLHVAGVATFS